MYVFVRVNTRTNYAFWGTNVIF